MTDIWDEIEIPTTSAVDRFIECNVEQTIVEQPLSAAAIAAEEKRQASIAARALERAALDAERAKRKQQLAEEKQKNNPPKTYEEPKQLSEYDIFISNFIEARGKELAKKNGRGFIGGMDKNRNPTRGADYERAVQDANYAWRNRKI